MIQDYNYSLKVWGVIGIKGYRIGEVTNTYMGTMWHVRNESPIDLSDYLALSKEFYEIEHMIWLWLVEPE